MNPRSRPPLKSITTTPTDPRTAEPGMPPPAVGEPTGAARKGVVTALRPNRFRPTDARHGWQAPTPEQPGIRIYAPPVYRHHNDGARWSKRYGDTPRAAYACTCGQTATATGPNSVAALVTEYEAHKRVCPGAHVALPEGRNAA
ncbi:hypothetical protein ACQEV4_05245 [Streptomyces shenzhenensis]|uniref:hypothetical protein n=1 Tax=Streptomyces shenzhenensis TaxID=943815 RepID=UPI003D8BC082